VGRFPKLVPDRFYNYVSNAQPDPPGGVEEGETWYDPDTANSYVYDGAVWVDLTVVAHSQLSGISSDDHHSPVTTSDPLTVDAGQGLGLSLGSFLKVDGSGSLDLTDDATANSTQSGGVGHNWFTPSYPGSLDYNDPTFTASGSRKIDACYVRCESEYTDFKVYAVDSKGRDFEVARYSANDSNTTKGGLVTLGAPVSKVKIEHNAATDNTTDVKSFEIREYPTAPHSHSI